MAYDVSKLLSVAKAEVGYCEKASNAYLDEKIKNAGRANYTKYGRDLVQWLGWETGDTFGINYAWCMQYVTWCFVKAFGIDGARKLLHGWTAYTPAAAQYFEDAGRLRQTPCIGAPVFFYSPSKASSSRPHGIHHVELVRDFTADTLYTYGGNTSASSGVVDNGGCVAAKSYPINSSKIYGYGWPDFGEPEEEEEEVKVDYEDLIKAVYSAVLGREPDESGMATWKAALEAGTMSPGDMVREVAGSTEREDTLARVVGAIYRAELARDATAEERAIWAEPLKSHPITWLIKQVRNSAEWRTKRGVE